MTDGARVVCLMQTFTAPAAGNYLFIVAGGQGGNSGLGEGGGLGATVEATVFLQAGAIVPIIVAQVGGLPTTPGGAGGGGLSAVYTDGAGVLPTIVAGLYVLISFGSRCSLCMSLPTFTHKMSLLS